MPGFLRLHNDCDLCVDCHLADVLHALHLLLPSEVLEVLVEAGFDDPVASAQQLLSWDAFVVGCTRMPNASHAGGLPRTQLSMCAAAVHYFDSTTILHICVVSVEGLVLHSILCMPCAGCCVVAAGSGKARKQRQEQ